MTNRTVAGLIVAGISGVALPGVAHADLIVGLTTLNSIIQFDSRTQLALTTPRTISGLGAGESIRAIDFRPATGDLFGVSSASRLYTININTGAATAVGGVFGTLLTGNKVAIDFNPNADALRVITSSGQNLAVSPGTGVATLQTAVSYVSGDPSFGKTPNIVGAAYANNVPGAATTRLYTIDASLDILGLQPSAFAMGRMSTVGGLLVDTGDLVGFDIASSDGTAYATLEIPGLPFSSLYKIDLTTGAAMFAGAMDYDGRLVDIAVAIPAPGSLALLGLGGLMAIRRRRN